jgi:tetratricopeptide (TPR) repeat protein
MACLFMTGQIKKQASGFSLKTWTGRFFVYSKAHRAMQYFESANRSKLKGTFVVSSVEIEPPNARGGHSFTMTGLRGGEAEGVLFVKTISAESLQAWVNFIRQGFAEANEREERAEMLAVIEARWAESETAKTPEQEKEEQIQRKVHKENAGKILRCAKGWVSKGNNIVKFNLQSFDPKDPCTGRMEGQYAGNHFTLAITLFGFIQLLSIIQWDDGKGNVLYKRDETKFWDKEKNACWNNGPLNGYDVCQHVKEYLHKIGKPHQSLLEVIMEGKVEALKCLRKHVGLTDAFFSHVQVLPIATMLETLKDAETRFAKELGEAPKFFIDYCGIRQCLSSDFTLERVVGAIETIGSTVAELGEDVLAPNALLKRIFCVLELFATIKAKGVLLVCGPGLQNPAQMLKLAELASDGVECKAMMDSLRAKCRLEEETIKIKAYIKGTVGFERTDKVVLAAIVSSCLRSAESVFAKREGGGASVLRAVGWMLYEVGDYEKALELLEAALAKGEAAHGAEAVEIADTVYRIGRCMLMTGGQSMPYFERDLRFQAKAHGSEEHASTARSLVGMDQKHGSNGDQAKRIECCERAIRWIQAAARPEDYADDRADALAQIGQAHLHRALALDGAQEDYTIFTAQLGGAQEEEALAQMGARLSLEARTKQQAWRVCLEWAQQSAEVRAAKHGPDHALAAGALGNMATAHGKLGDSRQAMALQLRVLGIQERAQGPLSREAGTTCGNIGAAATTKMPLKPRPGMCGW